MGRILVAGSTYECGSLPRCGNPSRRYPLTMALYCFDIDGTICLTPESNYLLSQPIHERIEVVNRLFEEGHEIHFFTARGAATGIDWRELTETQLREWGVKFHKLMMGKPHADLFIDDKAVSDHAFFSDREYRL